MENKTCVCLVTKLCPALFQPQGLYSTKLLCPWDFPGKNTGVGGHFLFQGIFLTQGLSPCFLYRQRVLHHWAALAMLIKFESFWLGPTPGVVGSVALTGLSFQALLESGSW